MTQPAHIDPADLELAMKVASGERPPAVRVPIESIMFRADLKTLYGVDEDSLEWSQLPGYEYARECARERMARTSFGQSHAADR